MSYPHTSFTILICAYNEEKNIAKLLDSILMQKLSPSLRMEQLVIVADGCLDHTVQVVSRYIQKDARIVLYEHAVRLGKPLSFNAARKNIGSDFLVSLDADIVLAHGEVISALLKTHTPNHISLISGRIEPVSVRKESSFLVQQAGSGRFMIRSSLQASIFPAFDNFYSVEGKILALHRYLYQHLELPDTPGTDVTMFAACKKMRLAFRYCPEAVVYFYPPSTWRDFFYQHIRTRYALYYSKQRDGSNQQLQYGKRFEIIAVVLRCFARAPFSTLVWFIAVMIGDFLFLFQHKLLRRGMSGAWPYVGSTK